MFIGVASGSPIRLVTVADAFEIRRETGADYDRQSLRARSAVLGGHVSARGLYTRLRLRLRHLETWATPSGGGSDPCGRASLPGGESLDLEWDTAAQSPGHGAGSAGRPGSILATSSR